MVDWIIKNKEWIFSGVGVAIVGTFFTMILGSSKKKPDIVRLENSGNSSNVVNAGRDVHISISSELPLENKASANIDDDWLKKINFDLWVINERLEDVFNDDLLITYKAKLIDEDLCIDSYASYTETLKEGGPIYPLINFGEVFFVGFPSLDFKVVNNSHQTIFITKIILRISDSYLDTLPLIYVEADWANLCHFRIVNEGWGNVKNMTLNFRLQDYREKPDFIQPFPYTRTNINFKEDVNIDLFEELSDLGIDGKTLVYFYNKLKETDASPYLTDEEFECARLAQGPYAGKDVWGKDELFNSNIPTEIYVTGTMSFTGVSYDKQDKQFSIKFIAYVPISFPELGAPGVVTGEYDAFLDVNRKDYEITIPVSQYLKSGDIDRFTLRLGALKSSMHELSAALVLSDGNEVLSKNIKLSLLVPRLNSINVLSERSVPIPKLTHLNKSLSNL